MRFEVIVRFSKHYEITVRGNEIVISINSEPVRGKANFELVKKLADHFDVNPSAVRIVSGVKSRKKIVEIL